MSTYCRVRCNSCKHDFITSSGHGFYFTIYRCEDCGESKRIDHSGQRAYRVILTDKLIGSCEKCGGNISENAKSRCPKCKSDDLDLDEQSVYSVC